MTINLCVYSDENFETPRKALVNLGEKSRIFGRVFEYDRKWLESTDFFEENKQILSDRRKGDGWCLWKPFVISESLKQMGPDDILLYMDATDTFIPKIGLYLRKYFSDHDILLSLMGENPNFKYCKRDTFIKMNCDSPRFWNSKQLEAGIIAVKNNGVGRNFISEYLEYCKDPQILIDSPNTLGPNIIGFVRHMYDQAVLTILGERHSVMPSKEIRNFVECNMWECLNFWEGGKREFDRKIGRVCDLMLDNLKDSEFWKKNYLKMIYPYG